MKFGTAALYKNLSSKCELIGEVTVTLYFEVQIPTHNARILSRFWLNMVQMSPILKHPQPMFLLQGGRQSFNLFIFRHTFNTDLGTTVTELSWLKFIQYHKNCPVNSGYDSMNCTCKHGAHHAPEKQDFLTRYTRVGYKVVATLL